MAYHDEYLELISAGLDGALSPEETNRLEAHLADCPDCKALYDQMWVTTKAVKGLPPVEPPADLTDRIMAAIQGDNVIPMTPVPRKKQPWGKWLATAAVLAVIVAGGYGMTQIRMGGSAKSANMAPMMAPATAEAPSNAPVAKAKQAAPVAGESVDPGDTGAYAGSGETTADEAVPAPETAEIENYSIAPGENTQTATTDGSFDAIQYSLSTQPDNGESAPAEDGEAPGDSLSASLYRKAIPSENGREDVSFSSTAPEVQEFISEETTMEPTITLTGNGHTFSATLNDSPAAQALRKALPLTVDMVELNGNEKYVYLDFSLPADAQAVDQIHTGDLMLFGSNCLVVFYEGFPTTYTYTPLGTLDNPAGLREALGGGDVTVTFAAQ